jgi:hypothetical protein
MKWVICNAFMAGFSPRRSPSGTVNREINDVHVEDGSRSWSANARRTVFTTGSRAALRSSSWSNRRTWVTPHTARRRARRKRGIVGKRLMDRRPDEAKVS